MQLASLSIADGALEEGAELLRELPEQTFDPTALWALYYLKKEQPKQALELTQKQLYKLENQILSCLGTLTMPKLMSEPDQQLRLAEVYHTIARTFGMLDSSGGLLCEAYLRMPSWPDSKLYGRIRRHWLQRSQLAVRLRFSLSSSSA